MTTHSFDDQHIKWYQLEGIDHASYHICNIDEDLKIVDVLFKFSANEKVILHRHHARYSTFILQGELRLYNADGSLIEIRPVGSYTERAAGGVPHTEGGGDVDVIGLFSNRGTDGIIYELLDENMETLATLGFEDFKALHQAQEPAVQPIKPAEMLC